MSKNNCILLGMAISYILVAVIQIKVEGLLPAWLYVTIAFVSFQFTMLEMIKNLGLYLVHGMNDWSEMNETNVGLLKRSIKTYSKFNVLNKEKSECENAIISLQNDRKLNKYEKRVKIINKIISIVSSLQIIFCTIQIIVTPLLAISYDKMTTNIINVTTLITFAMMFLSFFFSSVWGGYGSDLMEKYKIHEKTLRMHLDILDEIANENEGK